MEDDMIFGGKSFFLSLFLSTALLGAGTSVWAQTPPSRFVYFANAGKDFFVGDTGNVTGFAIDPTTGDLTVIPGSPFKAGINLAAVALDPCGAFAYVANFGSDNVSAFTVDPDTGTLTEIAGSPFLSSGQAPGMVTVDPTGRFAYVPNRGAPTFSDQHGITAYSIDRATGALTEINGSPFSPDGENTSHVTVSPDGKFAYVVHDRSDLISGYRITPTGALSPVPGSPFSSQGVKPRILVIDPTGRFVYVPNITSNSVAGFSINPTSGTITPLPGSPYAAGNDPSGARGSAMDPFGEFLYISNQEKNTIYAYLIDSSSGSLTLAPGSPFTGRLQLFPQTLSVEQSGQFLYVANAQSNNVSVYTIDRTTGSLTETPHSPFPVGSNPFSVTTSPAPACNEQNAQPR